MCANRYRRQPRNLPSPPRHNFLGSSFRTRFARALTLSVIFLLSMFSFCATPQEPIKILFLYFGDKDAPAFTLLQNGFRTRIEKELNGPVSIYEETFDEGWLGHEAAYEQTMEKFLYDKYSRRGIDIVVPVANYPIQFMQKRRKTLLPDAKLIYYSLGRSPQPSLPGSTGIVVKFDLAPTLEIAIKQNPGTRHVLLISGSTAVDRSLAQLFLASGQQYLQERYNAIDIRVSPSQTLEETSSMLATLPPDTITVLLTYYADSKGQGFVPARILPKFSAIANRPIYGWIESYSGRGIVGGSLIKLEATGSELAGVALRVLRGEKPESIPELIVDPRENAFDWRQMKRWHIGMNTVPAGGIVSNREYTFWELYEWRVIGLVGLIFIEAALLVLLARLAIAQKRSLKQLAHRREREALIADVAATFIELPSESVDAEIETFLQRLVGFFDFDRVSLFEFSPERVQLRVLCSRTSTATDPVPSIIDLHPLPWSANQIVRGTPIIASSLANFPDEAALREVLRASGVRSFAFFPVQHRKQTFAALSFSTVRKECAWEPDLIQALRTISDIVGSTLQRKRSDEVSSESRHRLTSIVESAMDAIVAVDTEQRIVVFNHTAEKIFGCSTEEVLGQPLDRFIPSRFRTEHKAHISRFAETGVTNRAMGTLDTLWALRSNGEEFPIEASISQVKTAGQKLFTVIIRDISERHQAERLVRESEARFRLVANTAPVLIWMADPDKLCTYFNQPWLDFTGRPLEAELGNGWSEGVHPDDVERCLGIYTQFFDLRQPFRMEYRLRDHEGNYRWILDVGVPRVDKDGSFAGYIGSCLDLTDRKQVELALFQSEQLKASILESLRNHVAVLDLKGTIVAATKRGPEFSAVNGINSLDLSVGANYFDVCKAAVAAGDRDVEAALAGVRAIHCGSKNYFEFEYSYDAPPNLRWFSMSVTPLETASGGFVISHQDITERKRHEQAIQELSGRLISAQEQERSRIARELHDDINQQVALLAIELQQLENSSPATSPDDRRKVQGLWQKTHDLSKDIQQLSHQLHSTKLEHLGIIVALRGLCDEFSKQHHIDAEFQFRQVPAGLDPDISLSLFRVAQESLHNIAKHSHAKKAQMELVGGDENIALRVSDDGIGFEPDAPQNQTGLGMVSMSERIRLVGGVLSVRSKPSKGTRVEAAIPLTRNHNALNAAASSASARV